MGRGFYVLSEELLRLNSLCGESLAFVYANPIIGSYRKGIRAEEARPAYVKWASENLESVRDAIQSYLKSNAIEYPYPYNQQLRRMHDGTYEDGVAEKEIVRGMMNYQRQGKSVENHFRDASNVCEIIDYEVPMFCLKGGRVSGRKIDAVGRLVGAKSDRLYIYEAKKNRSTETLLRCLMEAFSYSLFVDRVRFRESFGVRRDASIVLSPLIFEDSVSYSDLLALQGKHMFECLLKQIRQVADVDVEFTVVRKDDFVKNGKPVFPDVGGTAFDLKWLD